MADLIYDADGVACHGYLALPEGDGPFPGVLVTPAFSGLSAMDLAARGYTAPPADNRDLS